MVRDSEFRISLPLCSQSSVSIISSLSDVIFVLFHELFAFSLHTGHSTALDNEAVITLSFYSRSETKLTSNITYTNMIT